MITLSVFGPAFELPDPSPFVTKAWVLLKMSGLPFRTQRRGLRGAPKGKLPYIDDEGVRIADSTFIRLYLERTYSIDFERGLCARERALGWCVVRMLEEHLYWIMLRDRWIDDAHFAAGPGRFFTVVPRLIRPWVQKKVRADVSRALRAHGIGRHSDAEVLQLAARDLEALAAILGDNRYVLGAQVSAVDASAYAFVAGALSPVFDGALRDQALSYAALAAYAQRMREELFSDHAATASGVAAAVSPAPTGDGYV